MLKESLISLSFHSLCRFLLCTLQFSYFYKDGLSIAGKSRTHGAKKGQTKMSLTSMVPNLEILKLAFQFPVQGPARLLILKYAGLSKVSKK